MSSFVQIIFLVNIVFLMPSYGQGQGKAVMWQFKTEAVKVNGVTLVMTATLLPEWHLYSQQIKEGGPIPTRFIFERTRDIEPEGMTQELGQSQTYYDEVYEMDVTAYRGTVSFSQRFRLLKPVAVIRGKVEYMTCSEDTCIPGVKEFTVSIAFPKEYP